MSIIQLKDMASMGTKSYNPNFKTDFRARTQAEIDAKRKRDKEVELGRTMKENIQSDLENDPKYKELKKKKADLAELKKYMGEMGATTSNPEHASKAQEVDSQIESINSQIMSMEQGSNVAGQKAELDPFGKMNAPTKTKTDADVQRELSMSPQAQSAYKAYNKGKEGIFNAYKGESKTKVADAQGAYKDMLAGANDYFMHTGKQLSVPAYSTLASAAESEAKALKSKQDLKKGEQELKKGEKDLKVTDRKEMSELVKYADDRLDTWVGDKTKSIENVGKLKQLQGLLKKIVESKKPEVLFATVKLLALSIEPNSAVTDGEVDGFLGKTQASQMIQDADAYWTTLHELRKKGKLEEVAYASGKGSEVGVKNLKKLAETMVKTSIKFNNNFINAGANSYISSLSTDLNTVFKGTVTPEDLSTLVGNITPKLNSRLPSAPIPDATDGADETDATTTNLSADQQKWKGKMVAENKAKRDKKNNKPKAPFEYTTKNGVDYKREKGAFAWKKI